MGEHDKPVAWMCPDSNIYSEYSYRLRGVFEPSDTPLYTRPAQWVGLTEEEVQDSYNKDYQAQTRAIEQLLKEKNVDGMQQQMKSSVDRAVNSMAREWSSLTDDEIKKIIGVLGDWGPTPIKGYTRWLFDKIEAKLKEKNL